MSPPSPCVTSSKTTTTESVFHAIARGGRSGDTVIQAGDTVIGSRSKQVDTVDVVSFDPKRSA